MQAGIAARAWMLVGIVARVQMPVGTVAWAQTQAETQHSLANQGIVRALGPMIIISHVMLHSPELLYGLCLPDVQ